MAIRYFRGANNALWNSNAGTWSSDLSGSIIASYPLVNDDAIMVASSISTFRNCYMNGNHSVQSVTGNSFSVAGTSFLGGAGTPANNTFTVGVGGISLQAGAGPMTFGDASTRQVAVTSAAASFPINNASSSALTFTNPVSKTLTSTIALSVTGTGNTVFNGGIGIGTGTTNVTMAGNTNGGAAVFPVANGFTGGLAINSGWVKIGNASALGTGTVTMTGGKLSSSSTTGYTLANAFSLNGAVTLCDATNNGLLTIAGALTIAGTTTLSIPANYVLGQGVFGGTGAFTLASGELDLEGATGTKSGGTILSGGTLYLGFGKVSSDQLGTDSLTINSGSAFFCGSGNTTIANVITGTGGFLYARPRNSTVTFSNAGAYSGTVRIFAGASDGAGTTTQGMTLSSFPTSATNFTFINQNSAAASNTQTLKYTGGAASVTTSASISIVPTVATTSVWHHAPSNGSATMTVSGMVATNTTVAHTFRMTNDSSGLLSFTGGMEQRNTGVLSLSKTGTGPVTLSGSGDPAKQFTGTVQITEGTLNANSATALGSDASGVGGVSVMSGATLSLGAAPTYTNRSLAISDTGVSSTVGALVINNTGTSAFQSITLGGPTYIRAVAAGISGIDATFTPANNNITFGAAAGVDFAPFNDLAAAKVFSGSGSVTYGAHAGDAGEVNANRTHTYTGNTTLAYGTTYVVSSFEVPGTGGPLGNKSLTAAGTLLMTGGTLVYANQLSIVDYSGRFATTGGQQWKIYASTSSASSTYTTFSSSLQGNSSLSLMGGELYLSGNSQFSSFTGGVNLVDGTLTLNAPVNFVGPSLSSSPIGVSGTITFTGGTLQYTGFNNYDYSPRFSTNAGQQWKIDTNGQSVQFSSSLSSTGGSLAVSGGGTLALGVSNSYTNGTTLSSPSTTLKCLNAASLGTGGLAQTNGTTLHVATVDGKMTITGAHTNTGSGSRIIRIGAA